MATDLSAVYKEADELQANNKWEEAYKLLKPYADEEKDDDAELLWRVIRAFYWMGRYNIKNSQEKQAVARRVQGISDRAVKAHGDHFQIMKWSGIVLSWTSELEGMKCKIEKAFTVKEYFEKAIAIEGSDATVKHLLGRWCYEVSSVSWFERKVASAIFATPPSSSYEEALKYLKDAEETSPDSYKGNWLFLGKTYYQLSKKEDARKWLTKMVETEVENSEEKQYAEEAKQLLRKL